MVSTHAGEARLVVGGGSPHMLESLIEGSYPRLVVGGGSPRMLERLIEGSYPRLVVGGWSTHAGAAGKVD